MVGSIVASFLWCFFIGTELGKYLGAFFVGFGLIGFIPLGISCAVKY